MPDVFGPGFYGGLGASDLAATADYNRERARLEEELRKRQDELVGELALSHAAMMLTNALTAELQQEAEGKVGARRLSDPARNEDRNKVFLATAEGQLRRLSEQRGGAPVTLRRSPRVESVVKTGEPADLVKPNLLDVSSPTRRGPRR